MTGSKKSYTVAWAYLARLYHLIGNFSEDEIIISIIDKDIQFTGMAPKTSFQFLIRKPKNKRLDEFIEGQSVQPENIYIQVSKIDLYKSLAPFSKSAGVGSPKIEMSPVTIEVSKNSIKFVQPDIRHHSETIEAVISSDAMFDLPKVKWEYGISPNILYEFISRMASSGGPKISFKQHGTSLQIISEGGNEPFPIQTSNSQNVEIEISRMLLLKVNSRIKEYESINLGINEYYMLFEGYWQQCSCIWKLDKIE